MSIGSPDWKTLAPHRPLPPGSGHYISHPERHGDRLAEWIGAGGNTVLVGGPAGVGKSTELARAASQFHLYGYQSVLMQLDRALNLRRATPDRVLEVVIRMLGDLSEDWRSGLSEQLLAQLDSARRGLPFTGPTSIPPKQTATLLLNQLSRELEFPIVLIFDGLEKLDDSPRSAEIFQAIGELPEDIHLLSTIPWHAAFGPHEELIRPGERFVSLPPAPVHTAAGRRFLLDILARRLELPFFPSGSPEDLLHRNLPEGAPTPLEIAWTVHGAPPEFPIVIDRAVHSSGGLPRMFLQLLADAGTYARLRDGSGWPSMEHLEIAEREMSESLLRTLLPKDRQWLKPHNLQEASEIDPTIKVRLLAHGLLLERRDDDGVRYYPHPLLDTHR